MGLYAGDITAAEAWDILSHDKQAVLVDVRTPPEWQFAGVPDLSSIGKQTILLPWRNYPNFDINENFAAAFESINLAKDSSAIFLCKVGGRSMDAATEMTKRGYSKCYNIEDGMEGPMDEKRQRGHVAGWKAANLPWEQA